jgi:hypothetical protein
MKEKQSALKDVLYTLLFLPLILLAIIGFLVFTPIDYCRYKRTRYYKDTRAKYRWLVSLSPYVQLYDAVKKSGLPIAYHPSDADFCEGYGFFTYKDTLILNDLSPFFDKKENGWTVEVADEYVSLEEEVTRTLQQYNAVLGENLCQKAAVLVDSDLLEKHPDNVFEHITLVPVEGKALVEALKAIVE